jgi:type IV pilus assembly protein PilF
MKMKEKWFICIVGIALMALILACATPTEKMEKRKREAEAARNLGEAYLKNRNFAAASREFKKAESLYPDDHLLQYDLGLLYYSREKYNEAIQHFKKAIELKPDFGPALNSLGNAYAGNKDWDKAIFYYKKVLNDVLYVTPHFPLSNLGMAYFNKGDLELSEKYYLEALTISPNFVNALQGLAQTYIAMGRLPEAIEKLEKAVRKEPDLAMLHFQLANAYRLARDFKKAYLSYQKVIDLAPDSPLADQARQAAKEVRTYF